jgi:hypothetical protein
MKPAPAPPVIRHIANLWTLWDYPTANKPWSLERQLVDIKEAGFDGFTALATPEHGKLAAKHGLAIVGYFGAAKSSEFRPFNGHHCQVPVTDGKGKLSTELQQWLPFLEATLALWLKGKQAGREIYVVPEMGPVRGGYNFAQLPNSWEDAKVLRPLIAKAWAKALASK